MSGFVAGLLAGFGTFAVVGGILFAVLSMLPPRLPVDLDMLGRSVIAAIAGVGLVLIALAMRS